MKTIFNSYPSLASKSFNKTRVLFLATIALTTLLVSCTADEIPMQPTSKTAKEVNFRQKDSVLSVPTMSTPTTTNTTTTSSTTSGEIVPPPGSTIPPIKP
jgi:hypothetical protein